MYMWSFRLGNQGAEYDVNHATMWCATVLLYSHQFIQRVSMGEPLSWLFETLDLGTQLDLLQSVATPLNYLWCASWGSSLFLLPVLPTGACNGTSFGSCSHCFYEKPVYLYSVPVFPSFPPFNTRPGKRKRRWRSFLTCLTTTPAGEASWDLGGGEGARGREVCLKE